MLVMVDEKNYKLKPCPICGKNGKLFSCGIVYGGGYQVNAQCEDNSCGHAFFGHGNMEELAFNRARLAWNSYYPKYTRQ